MQFNISDICLLTSDVNRSADFYQNVLGLPIKRRDIGFAEFDVEKSVLAIWEAQDVQQHIGKDAVSEEGHWFMGAFEFETGEEVTEAYNELKSRGVNFVKELHHWEWGALAAYFADPDGYLWEIYAWVGEPYTW